MVNSSCGVCGKGTLNAIEIAYEPEIDTKGPIVSVDLITKLPDILILPFSFAFERLSDLFISFPSQTKI